MSAQIENSEPTFLSESLQYRVLDIGTRLAWIGCLLVLFAHVIWKSGSQLVTEALVVTTLVILYAVARFVWFPRIKTFAHADWLALCIVGPGSVGALASGWQTEQHTIAALIILISAGSVMITDSKKFWSWLVASAVGYVAVEWSQDRTISAIQWMYLIVFGPWLSVIFRYVVDESYKHLLRQSRERGHLVDQLSTTVSELKHQTDIARTARLDLEQNEKRLNAILERAPLVLCVMDKEGRYTQSRGRGLESLGLQTDEIVGQQFEDVFAEHPEMCRCVERAKRGESASTRVNLVEGMTHEIRYEPVFRQREIIGIIGVGIDVSTSVQMEQRKLDYEKQLLHAQKMESLGMLAGGVAHDLNNYLAAVVAFAESVIDQTQSAPKAAAEQIKKTALEAAGITEQMMIYAGRQSNDYADFESVDLNKLIGSMEAFLRAICGKSVDFQVHRSNQPVWIEGSKAQIQQVLLNLVKNASEAIESGEWGQVTLRVHGERPDDGLAVLHSIGEFGDGKSYCVLEVADNGIGIPEEHLEKIFDPYFTTKDSGHGFGMSIALKLILDHNGGIEVCKQERAGSVLRVYFPIGLPAREDKVHEDDQTFEFEGSQRLILLVDDEKSVLDSVSMLLQTKGDRVIAVDSSDKAMEQMTARHEEIDCLILDFSMPGTNGLELLNRFRSIGWNHPAILCSGYSMHLDEHPNVQFWPDQILTKPYRLNQLQEAIERACQSELQN